MEKVCKPQALWQTQAWTPFLSLAGVKSGSPRWFSNWIGVSISCFDNSLRIFTENWWWVSQGHGLVYSLLPPMGIPFAVTPLGQLYQSPPSPIPHELGRGSSHQSICFLVTTASQWQETLSLIRFLSVCSRNCEKVMKNQQRSRDRLHRCGWKVQLKNDSW